MRLLRAIDGAPKERDDRRIMLAHRDAIEAEPAGCALLLGDCNELVAGMHCRGIRDGVVDRDGYVRARIARERHGAVGERERDAAMRDAESVEHVVAHTHSQRPVSSPDLDKLDT